MWPWAAAQIALPVSVLTVQLGTSVCGQHM